MNRIEGKIVLVTGASAGIGAACARALAAEGAKLLLTARREEKLKAVADALGDAVLDARVLDVRDREAVLAYGRWVEEAGHVPDVLVNNAGLASGLSKIHEGDFEDWDRMLDTNVKGLLNVTRAVLPAMVARGTGHVVNIGSIAGRMAYPAGNVYNASKFAVRALSAAMNIDLVDTAIRVSEIQPGAVETEFSEVRFHGDRERAEAVYEGYQPLTAEDVAEAVRFVVNAPAHVNVQELLVMPTAQRNPYLLNREG